MTGVASIAQRWFASADALARPGHWENGKGSLMRRES